MWVYFLLLQVRVSAPSTTGQLPAELQAGGELEVMGGYEHAFCCCAKIISALGTSRPANYLILVYELNV